MRVDYRILGSLEALRDGEPLELGGAKQRAVLALLLVNANRLVTTDALTEALWSDKPPAKPLTSIQGYVSHLRRALSPERGLKVIVTEPAGYRLAVDSDALDLLRFDGLAGRGRTALANEQLLEASTALTEALALFRGAPLADFAYDDWARVEIDRIEELRLACLEDRIDADLALGRHAELVGELEALIAQHPLRERFRGQLMMALYRAGRQTEALDVYKATRTALVEELGLEPGPEIQALHGQILNQDPALAAPARQTPPQLLVRLPTPGSPFIGRERELADVTALIERADARIVTCTGPGGAGKTRLALQSAAIVSGDFIDGVYWISLAPLRAPELLETTFAQALEVTEQPGSAIADSIVSAFAAKRALVVVDNCEHLVDAVARLVRRVVEGCPSLVVLASSRERLGLAAERVYGVPPMASTDCELLFVERARALAFEFEPDEHVSAICEAVDGLPLAVELAAARTRSLSAQAISERLGERLTLLASRDRDLEERQRTLEATIAWSYDLLDSNEQRTLRALSVFAGGCTADAAKQVASADLDLLESLIDKSLIRHRVDEAGQDRYGMLETLREYAGARLEEEEEQAEITSSHRRYFTTHAAELISGDLLSGSEINLFEADRGNYRVVLLDALADEDGDAAIALVASLGRIWFHVGEIADSYALTRSALALPGGDESDRGLALCAAARFAVEFGDFDEARLLLGEAERASANAGDQRLSVLVRIAHSGLALRRGDFAHGVEWAREAVQMAQAMGSKNLEMFALGMELQARRVGVVDRLVPDRHALEQCLPLAERLLAWSEESALMTEQAYAHYELAQIYLGLGAYREALEHQQASLRLERAMNRRWVHLDVLAIGVIAGGLGDLATAIRLTSAARHELHLEGRAVEPDDERYLHRLEADARAGMGDDGYEAAVLAGENMALEDAVELALSLACRVGTAIG